MKKINIPYGRTGISFEVPESQLQGIYTPQLPHAAQDPVLEVNQALDAPIGSQPLEELARGKRNAVIIASDHTRPVPSRILMPALLQRLRKYSPAIDITILIATGCHRHTTSAELEAKFGPEIVKNEKIVIHDCSCEKDLCDLGILPSGGRLRVNRRALETELLISEGFIEPHFFAGFSGGRKSVLPGIAARESVLANHCSEFIRSPFARTGILTDNPIHQDMLYAATQAKLAFILNVVINEDKSIVKAFAGDMIQAHAAGCEFLNRYCGVKVPASSIVITSNGGYPLDQNVYQTVKGMTAAEAVCKDNGVIIIASSCSDGHGGEAFYQQLKNCSSARELLEKTAQIPRNETLPDQWQYQILARILDKFQVIVVTKDCSHQMLNEMKLQSAGSVEEALTMAYKKVGMDARIAVIPDGVSVVTQKC